MIGVDDGKIEELNFIKLRVGLAAKKPPGLTMPKYCSTPNCQKLTTSGKYCRAHQKRWEKLLRGFGPSRWNGRHR